jgi:hypothetical protein
MCKRSLLNFVFLASLFLALSSFKGDPESDVKGLQIAFMADVHLQDVYGDFQDSDYRGIKNPKNGMFATIRTMEAQLHSTRIFNENYFAFLAALDDVAKRGIKYVVLPGDFSDDGQPVNIRGLKKILDTYSETYNMSFFGTTGNHDPVRPFSRDAGKQDYLGEGGRKQPVVSDKTLIRSGNRDNLQAVITKDIQQLGYLEIVSMLGEFGFFPKKEYLYWETPFSTYGTDRYEFESAAEEAVLEKRTYPVPPQGYLIPDVSYLVEPVKGLWLLALDANVYIPGDHVDADPENPNNYGGAGRGYNNVLSHKQHLISWVKKVTDKAEQLGKTLVVFSHYPMLEFNDDASAQILELLGPGAMQLHRVPGEDVAQIFADAGIKLHFGGHMHINDTGIRKTAANHTLINVQIPSLAAYIPAYKLLTIREKDLMEVETIIIDSVPRYKEMFDLYSQEYAYLERTGSPHIWNKKILSSTSYHEFTSWHLKELVRLRFLPREWPPEFMDAIADLSGRELMILSHGHHQDAAVGTILKAGLTPKQFNEWTGFDLIYDFYRVRNADRLALKDIGADRMSQYQLLFESLLNGEMDPLSKDGSLLKDLKELGSIFQKFLNGAPADHFSINLNSGAVKDLTLDLQSEQRDRREIYQAVTSD